jgi:hypothetical protein
MKPYTLSILVVATAAVCVLGTVTVIAQSTVPVAFSAELVSTLYKYPSGEFGLSKKETYIRASNGNYAKISRDTLNKDGEEYNVRGVWNVVARLAFTVDERTRSVSSVPYSDAAINANKQSRSCGYNLPAESMYLLSHEVFKSTGTVISFSGGEKRYDEDWIAPDLGCYSLKRVTFRQKPGQPLIGATVTEVTRVTIGEPDPSLFDVPAGYAERSPSAILTLRNSKLLGDSLSIFDQTYASQRSGAESRK